MPEIQQNYTPQQTELLLKLYEELGTERIEEIAEAMNKPVRSIRSKLVKEGVYQQAVKPTSTRSSKSKKELLNDLQELVKFDTTGFAGSTKKVLEDLITFINQGCK